MKHLKIKLISLVAMGCMLVPYQSSTSKGGSSGGGSCTVEEKSAMVILQFPEWYPGRTSFYIPQRYSDPKNIKGGATLSDGFFTFYCQVKVTGIDCPSYSKTHVWTEQSRQMMIPVPTNTNYRITVDFYESCGLWDTTISGTGRPYYRYSDNFDNYQSSHSIVLDHIETIKC